MSGGYEYEKSEAPCTAAAEWSYRLDRPRLLDLFCGAGGAAVGYHRAGFDIVGVDWKVQPRYPFHFLQADAISTLRKLIGGGSLGFGHPQVGSPGAVLEDFNAIHAAPLWWGATQQARQAGTEGDHRDNITPTLALLEESGLPYVLEVGTTSPQESVTICGVSCGLRVVRHMRFTTNWPLMVPPCSHKHGGAADGLYIPAYGSYHKEPGWRNVPQTRKAWRDAAGLGWMSWSEAHLASPPAYTELIGHQLMSHLASAEVA